jgi:hypothetical protein
MPARIKTKSTRAKKTAARGKAAKKSTTRKVATKAAKRKVSKTAVKRKTAKKSTKRKSSKKAAKKKTASKRASKGTTKASGSAAVRSMVAKLLKKGSPRLAKRNPPDDKLIQWHEKKAGFKFSPEFKAFLKAGGTEVDSSYTFFGLTGMFPEVVKHGKWMRETFRLEEPDFCFCYDNGAYFSLTPGGQVVTRSATFKPQKWKSVGSWISRDFSRTIIG